jgi:hypothetical protein
MSQQIDVLSHRFDAYQQAIKTLCADHQSVAARKAAIDIRDEFVSDMPLLIADALTSYRGCQRLLAKTMVDRLADKQLTVRSTIEALAKAGWLSQDDATGILATLPKPLDSEHRAANGNPIDGYPLQQA